MATPYTVKLDAESARELAQRGGTIVLLGVPENTAVGVDQQVGPRLSAAHPCSPAWPPALPPSGPQPNTVPCLPPHACMVSPDIPGWSQVQGREDGATWHPPDLIQCLQRAGRLWAHNELLPVCQSRPGARAGHCQPWH